MASIRSAETVKVKMTETVVSSGQRWKAGHCYRMNIQLAKQLAIKQKLEVVDHADTTPFGDIDEQREYHAKLAEDHRAK